MSRTLKTEAVVLKKKSLLNKDVLVYLFSKEQGKIVAVAKGLKKITSRRSPHLETGNLIQAVLSKKSDRFFLQETNLISGFSELKKNQEKINKLYQFFFVLEKLLPEHQSEDVVYNLTKSFLVKLSQSDSKDNLIPLYFNKILRALGYIKKDHDMIELEAIISDLINEKMPSFTL